MKNMHNVKDFAERSEVKEKEPTDNFFNMVNDFLQSANYLNNSDEVYSCEKCSKTFASEKFLQIHSEATHKEKCTKCDF